MKKTDTIMALFLAISGGTANADMQVTMKGLAFLCQHVETLQRLDQQPRGEPWMSFLSKQLQSKECVSTEHLGWKPGTVVRMVKRSGNEICLVPNLPLDETARVFPMPSALRPVLEPLLQAVVSARRTAYFRHNVGRYLKPGEFPT